MRLPSSPGYGGKSSPSASRPSLMQWTVRAMTCLLISLCGYATENSVVPVLGAPTKNAGHAHPPRLYQDSPGRRRDRRVDPHRRVRIRAESARDAAQRLVRPDARTLRRIQPGVREVLEGEAGPGRVGATVARR